MRCYVLKLEIYSYAKCIIVFNQTYIYIIISTFEYDKHILIEASLSKCSLKINV